MRTIALSVLALAAAIVLVAAEPETPFTRIAKLATYISDGDSVSALESFDKSMKNYGTISQDLAALAAQANVLCSIDVVSDREADNADSAIHHLDLDWYMTLTAQADPMRSESRRMRVAVTLQRFDKKWRITALAPDTILAPITIK
jgi:hypothetical protein